MDRFSRKLSAVVIFICFILLSSFIFLTGCVKKKDKDIIEVAAILPMSGDAAKYGKWANQGIMMAVAEINAGGGINGKKLKVELQDSKTNPTEAVNAIKYLLSTSHPSIVLTTLTSVSNALIPITEKEKIILFANSTLPGITEKGRYIFRNVANLSDDVSAAVEYCAEKLEKKPAAVLWRNDDFGIWGSKKFEQLYKEKGGNVVVSESFDPKTEDFRTHILKIAKGKPKTVYILAYSESGKFIKQAHELGYKWQFVGITTLGDPEVKKIAGDALNGAVFTESAFDPDADNDKLKAYQTEYQKKYGEKSEVWAAVFYDAVKIYAAAIEKAGLDTENIRDALIATKDFPGISGKTTFLPNGDVMKPVNLKIIRNGSSEYVK